MCFDPYPLQVANDGKPSDKLLRYVEDLADMKADFLGDLREELDEAKEISDDCDTYIEEADKEIREIRRELDAAKVALEAATA